MEKLSESRKKVYFLTVHRRDRSPSQRFRFEQYLDYFESMGFLCIHRSLVNEKDDKILYTPGNYLKKLIILLKCVYQRANDVIRIRKGDIVFVQRESIMIGTALFEKMISQKAKLIYDFDDAIWLSNISKYNRHLGWLKGPGKIPEIIKVADHVIAGNDYLAGYAMKYNNNVTVIPTTVDAERFKIDPPKKFVEPYCVGWSGSFSTIPHFELLIPVLMKIKEHFDGRVYFKVIGDEHYSLEDLGIQGIRWESLNEVKELSEIDIGLMPLPDDEWTRGKCGLKGLVYMSMGIPTIMSPVGVNKDIISDGENGYLAETPEEWIRKITYLIEHPDKMAEIGNNGRETVLKRFSIEANREHYLYVLNKHNA